MKKQILIVSHSEDNECIQLMMDYLTNKNACPYRFDSDLFPTGMLLSLTDDSQSRRHVLSTARGNVLIDELSAVWYRRLRIATHLPAEMDAKLRAPAVKECHAVLTGMLESMGVFIVDSYDTVRHACHKQVQLQVARNLGIAIPRTLTSNDPVEVRRFFASCPTGMVAKMLSSFAIIEGDEEKVVFTNTVQEKDLVDLDSLCLCPMTFQEKIPKKLELRVTIVGNKVFSAAIDSQASAAAKTDWRKDGVGLIDCWQSHTLPADLETKLLRLMDTLHLNYGAIDIILTPDNRYVFLEINPSGEYFWLELNSPGFPITEAIGDVLLGDAYRR